jgi:hypothetical protein
MDLPGVQRVKALNFLQKKEGCGLWMRIHKYLGLISEGRTGKGDYQR